MSTCYRLPDREPGKVPCVTKWSLPPYTPMIRPVSSLTELPAWRNVTSLVMPMQNRLVAGQRHSYTAAPDDRARS
jgi:hypothetical protein